MNLIKTTGDVNGFHYIPWRFVDWGRILCYLWHPDTLSGLPGGKKGRRQRIIHVILTNDRSERSDLQKVEGIVLDKVAYLPVMAEISLGVLLNKLARLPLFQTPPQHLLRYIS